MSDGKLTAEQVREAIEENSWKEAFMLREFNESSWQAIADVLNATLGAGESRWFELFGTPERAARTLYESTSECRCCVIRDECGYDLDKCVMYDRDKLLEWLRGDAE